MKKKLLLTTICLVAIFLLTACGKKPVSIEDFKKAAEAKNMTVVDVVDQFADSPQIKTANVALIENKWQLEHYTLTSEKEAKEMFENNKDRFEAEENDTTLKTTVEMEHYQKYVLETADKYKVLIRAEDMFIYGNVPNEYKSDAKALLKDLGY